MVGLNGWIFGNTLGTAAVSQMQPAHENAVKYRYFWIARARVFKY
jgi:hypothetical protein